jgi:hypothetical protein
MHFQLAPVFRVPVVMQGIIVIPSDDAALIRTSVRRVGRNERRKDVHLDRVWQRV